jgi:hypothetical protein
MAGGAISCAVVFCRSSGLGADASVLAGAIRSCRHDARIVTFGLPGRFTRDYATPVEISEELRAKLPFDLVFLLEHAHANPPLLEPSFARRVVYVPNVEWISPADEKVIASGSIDIVLQKTRYSGTVFSALECAKGVKNGQLVTGWTTPDVGEGASSGRSSTQFLHVCGRSPQKNADVVVATWMRNPDFGPMTIVATARAGMDLSMPLRASGNLTLLLKHLPEPELRSLQRQRGIHLCPSFAEGFGHSLNEARAAAAVLITTQGPPMDEMVEDGVSGILVPVRSENRTPYHRVTASHVTTEDLEESVRRVLRMSDRQRLEMGSRARKLYEMERDRFHVNICRFIDA